MPGGQYIALSALHARMQQLDTLADNLSNVHTTGYRGMRTVQEAKARDAFGGALSSAVDTVTGDEQLEMMKGTIEPSGRDLDVAIEGDGFFVIDAPKGQELTRDGHFNRATDGTLVTSDGLAVLGADGPITLTKGDARIDKDGNVWSGAANVGKLQLVTVADPTALRRGTGARLIPGSQELTPVDEPLLRPASLEGSNVAIAEGLAKLTSVSRNFEALQRAISTLLNDVDGKFIDHMARR